MGTKSHFIFCEQKYLIEHFATTFLRATKNFASIRLRPSQEKMTIFASIQGNSEDGKCDKKKPMNEKWGKSCHISKNKKSSRLKLSQIEIRVSHKISGSSAKVSPDLECLYGTWRSWRCAT